MCRMKMQRPLFKLWRKIRNCYLNVIYPQIVFWNYPWRVLGCLTKYVSKPRHPSAAQCLRPFLPAKLLLDFQVFLATLHAWWPDCHQGGMLVGRDGSSVVWKRSDTKRCICAMLCCCRESRSLGPQAGRHLGSPASLGGLCRNQIPLILFCFTEDKCRSESWD